MNWCGRWWANSVQAMIGLLAGPEFAKPETDHLSRGTQARTHQENRSGRYGAGSVNAAWPVIISASRRAVYDKINHVEPRVTRALVVETARRMLPVVRCLLMP